MLYHFHKSEGYELQTTPFLDSQKHGVLATRAPKSPNAIGISVVRLLCIQTNIIEIENVKMLNKAPLLDIKPYFDGFDIHKTEKTVGLKTKIKE